MPTAFKYTVCKDQQPAVKEGGTCTDLVTQMAPDLTRVIYSQVQQPYPDSTNCGVMQREDGKDSMTDTWAGMNRGHWASWGFAAMGSLDLTLVRVENVWDLAESLNWTEPYDMKAHSGAGLNDRPFIERCDFRRSRVNWVNLQWAFSIGAPLGASNVGIAAAGCSPSFHTFYRCIYWHLKLPRQM